jgi:hypothetical protein
MEPSQTSSQQSESAKVKADDKGMSRVAAVRAALRKLEADGDTEGLFGDDKISVLTSLRNEYKTHLDLYKHYLTVAASFNVFYYAVTGAVVSYALAEGRWRAPALTFPMLMSFFFALVFWKAWKVFKKMEDDIKNIARALGGDRDEVNILTRILECSFYMYCFNFGALFILFGGFLLLFVAESLGMYLFLYLCACPPLFVLKLLGL